MFNEADLDRLIQAMKLNAVTSLEVDDGENTLNLQLAPLRGQRALPTEIAPKPVNNTIVKSPAIGLFLARGSDDGLPALQNHSVVQVGEILGYIIQGSVRVPITAQANGKLMNDTPKDGEIIGLGDTIFSLVTTS